MRNSYCLYCFEPLASSDEECPACHRISRRSLRRYYWNQNPRLRSLETTLKFWIALAAGLAWISFIQRASGPGAGYYLALPIIPAAAAWMTVSKLTRHMEYFRPDIVWGVTFWVLCLLFGAAGSWIMIPFLLAILGVIWLTRRLRRWKHRLQGVPNNRASAG